MAEEYKKAYEYVYLIALLFNVPLVMILIYHSLVDFKHYNMPIWMLPFSPQNLTMLGTLLATMGPALCAGKLSAAAEKIKAVLHDKLLVEDDALKCCEIKKFISYVEARPLKFTVCEVIPLNADLIGMVFTFCVTYLIVIVQFSHLF